MIAHLLASLWPRSILQTGIVAAGLVLAYVAVLAIYRLFFHPLAKFPGPKRTAVTYWYEFYYDVVYQGGGQYSKVLKHMHEKYGPIVRITPNEVHIDDPDWFDVYAGQGSGQMREKYGPAAKMAGTSLGVFGTSNFEKHRLRRNAISHFFSKQSVRTMEPMLRSKLEKLCETMREQADRSGENVVELRTCLLAFGTDVICDFALGTSPHDELLMDAEKQRQWRNTIYSLEDLSPVGKQFPSCIGLAKHIPVWFLNAIWPDLGRLMQLHKTMSTVAKNMITRTSDEEKAKQDTKNVFEAILHSTLPSSEKRYERLVDEGFELIVAGGETVARAACAVLFHLISNSSILAKVRLELRNMSTAAAGEASLRELEGLPWLTAVIKESLRIEAVISTRLPLVSPAQEVVYGNWILPPGTPFSMSPSSMLHDPRCFTDPDSFKPERWMVADEQDAKSDRYFVPFSRGVRNCLGLNLAHAELYFITATLVTRFDLELFDTVRERDIDHSRDCFVGVALDPSQELICDPSRYQGNSVRIPFIQRYYHDRTIKALDGKNNGVKKIVVPNDTHMDFYDKPEYVGPAVDNIVEFFKPVVA